MLSKRLITIGAILCAGLLGASQLVAQQGGRGGRGGSGRGGGAGAPGASGGGRGVIAGGGGGGAYPSRPPADPAVAARGKAIYDGNCSACHAPDMRGASGGINLVRNQMTMDDQNAELIGPFIKKAHAAGKAPAMTLTDDQTHDLVIYMHTFMNYRGIVVPPDINAAILAAGKASEGQKYFAAHCASCHSVTGDLAGISAKYAEPKAMQNALVAGGGGGGRGGGGGGGGDTGGAASSRRTVTVTVTMPNGTKLTGRQVSKDDFLVTLVDSDGVTHSIRRDGDVPKVETNDPMKAHRDLLAVYTDADIHNLTAYLVTVK